MTPSSRTLARTAVLRRPLLFLPLLLLGITFMLLLFLERANAQGALPCQGQAGCVCYVYNPQGQCVSYSYYAVPTAADPVYAPTYASPSYVSPVVPVSTSTVRRGLEVTIDSSRSTARVGDIITFDIELESSDTRTRTVDVIIELPDELMYVSSPDDCDDRSRDEVECRNVRITRQGTETVSFRARVDRVRRDGDEVTVRVEADEASDEVDIELRGDYYGSSSTYYAYRPYDCYDRYGTSSYYDSYSYDRYRYYDDCYYYDSRSYRGTDRITVTIGDVQDPIRPGAKQTYNIALYNPENITLEVPMLRAIIDSRARFDSATDSPERLGRDSSGREEIRWRNIRIAGRSTYFVTLVVDAVDTYDGYSMTLDVRTDTSSDTETTLVRF